MSAQLVRPNVQSSVSLFDKRMVGRETKRWLFFPLDVIIPRRKQEISWLAQGGEETNSKCLQKYGTGFIPRGLSALVEMGADHMPEEQLRNVGGGIWQGMMVEGQEVVSSLPYVPVYPGDAVANILSRSYNDGGIDKGVIELKSLIGREWEECHSPDWSTGILDIVETAFFGDGMEPTLRGLKEQITHGKVSVSLSIDLGQLKDEKLLAIEKAEGWGMHKLDIEHTQLKQGTHAAGHVYTYSPLARLLLAQLEVQPQDQPFAELAKMTGSIAHSVENAMHQQSPQSGGMSMADTMDIARKLVLAEQRIAELEAAQPEKPLHWKTREKLEREAAQQSGE